MSSVANVIHLLVTARDHTAAGLRSASRAVGRWGRSIGRQMNRIGRDAGHQFGRGFINDLRRVGNGVRNFFTGLLSDGVGQALAGLMRNPIVAAAIVAALVGIVTIIGSAIAGALVAAFGFGIAGMAAALLFQSEKVKKDWSKTFEFLKKEFGEAAKPFLPVLERARVIFRNLGKDFAPHFEAALTRLEPAFQKLLGALDSGIREFGKRAWEPLVESFRVFSEALGPELRQFFINLGDAFAELADTVKKHPTEIAMAFGIVLNVLVLLIKTVNFLANAWVSSLRVMSYAIGVVASGFAFFFRGVMDALDKIMGGIIMLADTLGLPVGKLKEQREAFQNWRDDVFHKLNDAGHKARDFGKTLDEMNRVRRLEADISSWQAKIAQAKASLKSVPKSKRSAIQANINDLSAKVRMAKAQLAQLRNKTVYVSLNVADASLNRAHRLSNGLIGRAMGGITGAATGGIRGRATLVGEHGPEIVNLPPGSHVRSNNASRQMLQNGGGSGGGGGSAPIVVQLVLDGRVLAEQLVEPNRYLIRTRGGGNVQRFLGQAQA